MILSGLAAGAPWLCYYRAVQIGQVPRMVPIDRLSVALTLIRSVLLLYEQFTWKSGGFSAHSGNAGDGLEGRGERRLLN
ncbi:hypothetical protein [Clostridium sp. M62/1]|uniref:EamA family transporter n=1 Tax=Clostridium sp. M62/1 TaxID=411486 RepID=UPI000677A4A3